MLLSRTPSRGHASTTTSKTHRFSETMTAAHRPADRGGDLLEVAVGERARGRAYPGLQVDAARAAELLNVQLAHVAIAVAGYELHVQDADDTPVGEGKQLLENPEGMWAPGNLDREEVDAAEAPATTYGVRAHEFKCEAPLEVRAGPLHERRGQDHDAAALE